MTIGIVLGTSQCDGIDGTRFTADADGSPRAYCPGNKGLDFTANAGKEGHWYGVVTDIKLAKVNYGNQENLII